MIETDKAEKTECCCDNCQEKAMFFHSACCGVHFEGVIKDGKHYVVCELCGKLVGELK